MQKVYVLPYDMPKAKEILTRIVNTSYSSTLYSLFGIAGDNQEEYSFWTKQSHFKTFSTPPKGAKITVRLAPSNGQTKLTAVVSINPVFWLFLMTSIFFFICAFLQVDQSPLLLSVSCIIVVIAIYLDRLNKKMLLSLLERYI